MATYKKRGHKPKTKGEKQQNIEEGSTTAEVFNTLDETASKTEDFVAKNQKYIFIIIALIFFKQSKAPNPSRILNKEFDFKLGN